ncbi:MAG: 1,4-dihydroxy-2-naphthoate polyprenyltransferase [Cyclobacteriaceae bacterium]|nr:1,4-dihydroxy-2-naphthoate polyprenyltransferase [Cyclobacteriaceae bacterium]
MSQVTFWIQAIRPRTLPLALASIGMGSFLAAFEGSFRLPVLLLSGATTLFLQVLSNLANDYGDALHGADHARREGPSRAVQSGKISAKAMKNAIYAFVILSLLSGLGLLFISFADFGLYFFIFLFLGMLAVGAALNYTMGTNPYGYAGFGDVFVLVFFGFVGVVGTYFCHTGTIDPLVFLPALSCGLLSTAVLNVNNIRDIQSDRLAGKMSIPVRIGRTNAIIYHWALILVAIASASVFVAVQYQSSIQFLFVATVPFLIFNAIKVSVIKESKKLDPYLKQMAISTLLFIIAFGIGNLI